MKLLFALPRKTRETIAIVALSVLGGIAATLIMPLFVSWIPYDYAVYMQGARLVRAKLDPYAQLPYWYPLPIVLFTTLPWSFLPDQFAWAFAFIPLGLLHLRFGRRAVTWWLFFPLLINVAYAEMEGWLILPLIWILEDVPALASLGALALFFKPAYGMFLVPYRIGEWILNRRWKELAWLGVLSFATFVAAFCVDRNWHWSWLNAILHRSENLALIERNMTVWGFVGRSELWLLFLVLMLIALGVLAVVLFRRKETRGAVLLAASLFFFPGGLNPVSSMMVIPLAQTTVEIITLVIVSWLVAGLEILVGGFGGFYLLIVLAALALLTRRTLACPRGNA